MKQFITEIKRFQELAGIVNENDSNNTIIFYSTWLSNNKKNQKYYYGQPLFPGKNNLTAQNAPGSVNGGEEKGIECMGQPFTHLSDPNDEDQDPNDFKITIVKFRKSIDEVFIDYGDFILETFSGVIDDINKAKKIINNNKNNNIETPLSSLPLKPKFSENQSNKVAALFGCYVKEIKSSEIIDITEQYQEA